MGLAELPPETFDVLLSCCEPRTWGALRLTCKRLCSAADAAYDGKVFLSSRSTGERGSGADGAPGSSGAAVAALVRRFPRAAALDLSACSRSAHACRDLADELQEAPAAWPCARAACGAPPDAAVLGALRCAAPALEAVLRLDWFEGRTDIPTGRVNPGGKVDWTDIQREHRRATDVMDALAGCGYVPVRAGTPSGCGSSSPSDGGESSAGALRGTAGGSPSSDDGGWAERPLQRLELTSLPHWPGASALAAVLPLLTGLTSLSIETLGAPQAPAAAWDDAALAAFAAGLAAARPPQLARAELALPRWWIWDPAGCGAPVRAGARRGGAALGGPPPGCATWAACVELGRRYPWLSVHDGRRRRGSSGGTGWS